METAAIINRSEGRIKFLKRSFMLILLAMFVCAPNILIAQTSRETLKVEQKEELLKKLSPEEQQYLQNELA